MKRWNHLGWRLALVLTLALLLPLAAHAESLDALYLSRGSGTGYAAYETACRGMPAQQESVQLWDSEEGVALSEGESTELVFTVEADTFGYPVFTYAMTEDNILDNAYTLMLDGAAPYDECHGLTLDSIWLIEGDPAIDRYGNEVITMPVKSYGVESCRVMGKDGLYSKGMGMFLSAGEHTLTVTCREGGFRLYGLALEGEIPVAEQTAAEISEAEAILLQAERVPRRNNPNIRPAADHDVRLTPYSSDKKVINYIEDISNKYPGDMLQYRFEAPADGWYGLSLRMRQAELANFPVFRTFMIDGVIPGAAFDNAMFRYSLNFGNQVVQAEDGTPAKFYLTAGEHTLTVTTTVDPIRSALKVLTMVSDEMASLALDITKVTGGNSDRFRDFNMADFDFHIAEDLNRWVSELEQVHAALLDIANTDERVGALSNLELTISIMKQLAEKPDDLPKKLTLFSQGTSSARAFLVAVVESLSTSPMGLDSICLFTDESQLPADKGFLESAAATAERFAASFGEQSYAAGEGEEGRLQVWVNRPRQYLEILQRMADTEFTKETGIEVDFSIMPDESKLILANASGSAPDVALGVSTGRVYDLAVRGALKDLRTYDNFKEVGRQFPEGLIIPGVCDDGVYALPETFNFYVLYYRKDILDNLNLEVPDSYEDVLAMLPTLHRFGLNFNNFVSNVIGYKSFPIITPFIFQNGGKLYEPGDMHTRLDQAEAIEGLQVLTDSFIIYDMDFEVNSFYQAFRDGTLPIGTSNYGMYNLLMNAAPELADKWDIALYPGMTDENGEVQRWTGGAEQSCFIFSTTEMTEESWTFLSWWMSEEVQTEFAYTLQSTLGNEYLWNSANTAAFLRSPWPSEHKRVIAEQMTWTYEAPRVPGAYMVERELSNAVNAVVLDGTNLRAALDEAIKRIDREVERKLEEFGRLKDGEMLVPFEVPDIETVRRWLE